jgi:hypothetical protein
MQGQSANVLPGCDPPKARFHELHPPSFLINVVRPVNSNSDPNFCHRARLPACIDRPHEHEFARPCSVPFGMSTVTSIVSRVGAQVLAVPQAYITRDV